MLQPASDGLYHPTTTDEIIALVMQAIDKKLQVRVRGAAQSVASAIFTDGSLAGNQSHGAAGGINMMLNNMRMVSFNDALMQVTVEAGCNLGFDPNDPNLGIGQPGYSTKTNGLFYQLAQKNYAIPNMSDAIHQTVAGFISTGSSGGSIAHSFLEAVVSITVIDGTGKLQTHNKPGPDNPDDIFYAVGVSLGLLGIITSVTLQCVAAFNIIGTQTITPATSAPIDFFGPGSGTLPSLETFLNATEFTRLMWWPYPTVSRLVSWQARTMVESDYNSQTGPPNDFKAKPYKDVFPAVFGSELPSEALADCFFSLIGNWQSILTDLFGNEVTIAGNKISTSTIQGAIGIIWPYMLPMMLNMFFPLDGTKPAQQFWDTWNDGLPMDSKEYSNNLFPANHSEFWVPLTQAQPVMAMLQKYYSTEYREVATSQNNNVANGCYVVEVFGAKASEFWLSPSYGENALRINLFSFANNNENVSAYYQQFWDLFKTNNINFRLHWGYYLPPAGSNEGSSYLTSQYPKWNQFITVRETMDPHNIFLTSYWASQLNITNAGS